MQDGSILVWKFNVATNCFEPAASLKGHTLAVVSLIVGANRLYSGSMDNSIRVSWFYYEDDFATKYLVFSLENLVAVLQRI